MTAVDGVLLAYHRPIAPWMKDASTVLDHLGAFRRHSRHRVWEVNVDLGFPDALRPLEFRAILLHYSLFGMWHYHLDAGWLDYLDRTSAYKVAFFQDECTRCGRRFEFLNDHDIDCVYTCLEPSEFRKVYEHYTTVSKLVSNLPGYVPDRLVDLARELTVPLERRTVDVGYRGRPLPAYLGHGGMEKHEIGERFGDLAAGSGLRLDVATREADRLYGDDWYRWMANCRCMLGVESGVSAFDLEDEVFEEHMRRSAAGLSVGADDLHTLPRWEDVVYYRTISPRHFEAAALRVCQVLFEGRYSGVMDPMVHYIPLKKDFSNLDEVVRLIRDDAVCQELTENAYRDLIASREYSYERFVAGVDDTLESAGLSRRPSPAVAREVDRALAAGRTRRRWRRLAAWAGIWLLRSAPGQRFIQLVQPVTLRVRRLLANAS
jgi:hypothetical protein